MTLAEILSKNETKCIKGILVCMVLLSHLSARVELFSQSVLGTIFSAFGSFGLFLPLGVWII